MTIAEWINDSQLDRLDAELLLQYFDFPDYDRSFFVAHADDDFSPSAALTDAVRSRQLGTPLAYITGTKEFYGRNFIVEQGKCLIPRAETEDIIDFVLDIAEISAEPLKIVDVGTGSGCIATTLALEIPEAQITAIDISDEALAIAKQNAKKHGTKVTFQLGDLMDNFADAKPDVIVANLPYVDQTWDWLDKTSLNFEPQQALYAENGGLEFIYRLIEYFVANGKPGAHLILEADPSQHRSIITFAMVRKLELSRQRNFILQFTL
ncbi:peptide chain release factor N(5)-glutamine methyltransferase [Candidatus Saccharibacteria bacterium]|nr:peptide chain release factor N(5)-glutamine methyltransferase [Candidatus Saccharibacteria bacterium]